MAVYTVTVVYEPEMSRMIIVGSDLNDLERGDYVRFSRDTNYSGTVTVTGFNSNWEGSFTSITLPSSSSSYTQVRVASNATDGYRGGFGFYKSGSSSENKAYRIIIPDTTPDSFSLPNRTELNPKTNIRVGSTTVSGINTSVYLSMSTISGTPINVTTSVSWAGNVRTGSGVHSGETVTVYADAPTGYGESYTCRLTIGSGTYADFTVSTRLYPYIDQVIPFGHATGSISLKADIAAFFGGEGSASLSEYYKYPGGLHVPSMGQNSSIPTSGTISLSDFRNAYTAFYFIKSPAGQSARANTLNGSQYLALVWNKVSDWEIGWGDDLELTSSYMYELVREDGETGTVYLDVAAGQNKNTLSTGNTYARLSATVAQNTEKIYYGKLRIYARNSVSNSTYTIMREVPWNLIFYGP